MIKPETQIEIGKWTGFTIFCITGLSWVLFELPIFPHREVSLYKILLVLFFTALYGCYFLTIIKKCFKIHFLIWIVFVVLFIYSFFNISKGEIYLYFANFILIILLSQSIWGIYRKKRGSKNT
jgi:hypothetical protein